MRPGSAHGRELLGFLVHFDGKDAVADNEQLHYPVCEGKVYDGMLFCT